MDAVRVQSERPVLEITTHNAKLHITHSKPRMRIRTKRPTMHIERQQPTFKMNWADVQKQIKGNLGTGFSPEYKSRMRQKTLEAIGKLSVMGDKMAHTETGQTIPIILKDEFLHKPMPEVQLQSLDPATPKVEWNEGHFSIEWSDYVLEIEWEEADAPEIQVEPYSVEVRIRNEPVVRFKMNPKKVKDPVGNNVDKTV